MTKKQENAIIISEAIIYFKENTMGQGTKQTLSLTDYAWYILKCDYSAFIGKTSNSQNVSARFICDLFLKFFMDSNASVEIICKQREREIQKILGTKNEEAAHVLIKAECSKIKRDAAKRIRETSVEQSKHNTVYIPFEIPEKIALYAEGSERFYYSTYKESKGHYMRYFSAVIEEYVRLPYYEREKVYFKEIADTVKSAMLRHCALIFCYEEKKVSGYPLGIELDEWSSYNYLLLLDKESKVHPYRIARMTKTSLSENDIFEIDNKKKQSIYQEQITPVGIQFAGEEAVKTEIFLTEAGWSMYNRMVFLRPRYTEFYSEPEKNGYICNFECSERQIRYYFFKFGKEAEILSPKNLREYFKNNYKKAYKNHEN